MAKIYDELRKAITTSSSSRYRLWKETGIDQGQLARFMSGISGLSVESMERLVDALGLEIVVQSKKVARKAKNRTVNYGKLRKSTKFDEKRDFARQCEAKVGRVGFEPT